MSEPIGFLISDTARLYRRAFDARTRDSGFTSLQWRLMKHVQSGEGARHGPLAEYLEVEPITLSRMIDRLVESGLVERRPDPADRRARLLFLTPRAHALLKSIQPAAERQAEAATEGLTSEERARLLDLVRRVRSNLSRRVED
ncbi:MAG: MarR family transcriptional regulator [Sphingopyxis sp.]|uniref:MarR family winged helix-turn-helix transcriptional regulator n=1 Tax=Sphingopyxis sp. TaxID=1908224 RepID=UPI003D80C8F2